MTPQTVFERNEKKFLLDAGQYKALRALLEARLQEDAYGQSTLCTLYYDTVDGRCGRAQLEKPLFKEKLRLRSYGVPAGDTTVYLELKKKLDGVTHKRRMALPMAEARAYMQSGQPPHTQGQVFREIDWFCRQYALLPGAVICYDRVALVGAGEDAGLRITFDEGLRMRTTALDLGRGDWGSPLLAAGQVLMEIKSPAAIPLWLCRLLSAQKIYSCSYSKYGQAYLRGLQGEVLDNAG